MISIIVAAFLNFSIMSKATILTLINILYLILLLFRRPYAAEKLNNHAITECFLTIILTLFSLLSYSMNNEYYETTSNLLLNTLNVLFSFFSFFEIFKVKIFLLGKKILAIKIFAIFIRKLNSK